MQAPNPDLQLNSYNYDLPDHLIASRPIQGRHNSKLLVYDVKSGIVEHHQFKDIEFLLPENAQIIVNQSKVFACRLLGKKSTGGACEIFFLSPTPDSRGFYPCLVKSRGKKNIGDTYFFDDDLRVRIEAIQDGTFLVSSSISDLEQYLSKYASIPIPPYIRDGVADEKDQTDYQTVYAKKVGSVAAPTAGLHFTDELFSNLEKKNIRKSCVTLHVGMGTFAPVKSDNILDHKMHTEAFHIDAADYEQIKKSNYKVAVGTTSLRVLESAHRLGTEFKSGEPFETNIFLHPGVEVKSIDALITNFHLPKSTLLMLVSSLIGREKTLELYKIAVENEYRFFSYGDAMLIKR